MRAAASLWRFQAEIARPAGRADRAIFAPQGATISIAITPRNVGAALGIAAALATICMIMFRLMEATAPIPTPLMLLSESADPVSVQGLQVDGEEVLPAGWTPSAAGAAPKGAQATVLLKVGRPSQIKARLSVPRSAAPSCTLDPRPHGACLVKVRLVSATELRCDFECKSEARSP